MAAEDLLVTFTRKGDRAAMVFQAASDIENSLGIEVTTEPGIIDRVTAKYPRRFAMMIAVSDDLKDLPAVGAAEGEFTKDRGAIEQYKQLEGLVAQDVYIDARSVAQATSVYTVENVRAIDSLQHEDGFKVQVLCTEAIRLTPEGGGLTAARRGRITIPVKATVAETKEAPLGAGNNVCIPTVTTKKKKMRSWVKSVGKGLMHGALPILGVIDDYKKLRPETRKKIERGAASFFGKVGRAALQAAFPFIPPKGIKSVDALFRAEVTETTNGTPVSKGPDGLLTALTPEQVAALGDLTNIPKCEVGTGG